MEMLRQLHVAVHQRFTFLCENVVAWFDQKTGSYNKAIDLMGDNDFEIETKKLSADNVISDGCRVCLFSILIAITNYFYYLFMMTTVKVKNMVIIVISITLSL